MEKITSHLIESTVHDSQVRAWEEEVLLPTYQIGQEEKNPIFLEKRVYQGSSGIVYPYAVIEKIADTKRDMPYKAVFIENEYLKLMALPQLGGRLHMAYDKVKRRHFVYYNQVVKPALVGLAGPWISGGIEFNWPQHHRPSTFLPLGYSIEEHADGSKTLWCSEVERMCRTKGMHGFRLYPGRAYVEIAVKLYNRTPFPQTFLWWANPAVAVHEQYHSVFPPDVDAVFDHGKRGVSKFPIATGEYYKQDYSEGVDISQYKNIPVPTSYMAVKSKYDFVGGYQTNCHAGLLHVADHHLSPGKKQWTWGCGEFGRAWDRNLTDEDGPYIELMTGVFTDNQPDFSWLQPFEERTWQQYFMPYSEVGMVKNATKEAIINVQTAQNRVGVIVHTTAKYENALARIVDLAGMKTIAEQRFDISPDIPYKQEFMADGIAADSIGVDIMDSSMRLLVRYRPQPSELKPPPMPARAAMQPKDINTNEALYLTGLHIEQYRHATYLPTDYYEEALRRDPADARCNNAMGLWYMRRGQFAIAQTYFRRALDTLTERNPNPYDGEPCYNLGWALSMQGRHEEAYDMFYKSVWNAAWQDAGYMALALTEMTLHSAGSGTGGELYAYTMEKALCHVEKSLIRNWHNHKARALKASILRKLGRPTEALQWIEDSIAIDGFNIGAWFEKYLLTSDHAVLTEMNRRMYGSAHTYIEYAIDYAAAAMYSEAAAMLRQCIEAAGSRYPMLYYFLAYYAHCQGKQSDSADYLRQAFACSSDGCFPNRIEEVAALQYAIGANEQDYKALYYLGNFWYNARQYDNAIECWEQALSINAQFPSVMRNLALAYYNKRSDKERAQRLLEQAFALEPDNARMLMELDQLYKKMGKPHEYRLNLLQRHETLVEQRDDLCLERIALLNQLGRYVQAKGRIEERVFHPWEGGEGKVPAQHIIACRELAKQSIAAGNYEHAITMLQAAMDYPPNLGEGKLAGAQENDIHYYMGLCHRSMGAQDKAQDYFLRAADGLQEPQQAFFYNDQQPDQIFYQGLAWRALGNERNARRCFNKLIAHGEQHLFEHCRIDYFAVSLPDLAIWDDDLGERNSLHCYYVMGLGHLGLGAYDKAREYLSKAVELGGGSHQGALVHLRMAQDKG
jgi:tetratricopeptide (TPR) repeat protein